MSGYIAEKLISGSRVYGFGDDVFRVCTIDRKTANRVIAENHYSKKFYSASRIHLGVFVDGGGLRGFYNSARRRIRSQWVLWFRVLASKNIWN